MADPIRITPGGLQSAKPPHLIGAKGAAPFTAGSNVFPNPPGTTIDGFQNLIDLNGDVVWSLLNGSSDEKATNGVATLFLGGNTKGVGDNVDVVVQNLLSSLVDVPIETGVGNASVQKLNANGEISTGAAGGTDGTHYGSYGQVFTTAGTVTVTAASPIIVGAGTTWNVDVLTANYAVPAANLSRNTIEPGDIIAVGAAGSRVYFRIVAVVDATHLQVFPTPTAGNPAIGAGKAYSIIRTGYGSWSRVETIIVGTTDALYGYYAGNSGLQLAGGGHKPGTFEAVAIFNPTAVGPASEHYQCPKTVDSAGVTTGVDVQADDVIFYKGFMLYGAGSGISWTVANFPSAVPFGATDFPAKNIEIINRTGRFVTFERNGDQIIAIFEDNQYLVTATGAVPEFAFYKLPELLGIIHAARAEPCGINGGLVFGRPSCSGRGSIFYISNRGLENSSGGLAEESSRVVSNAIITVCGTNPLYLSWDDAFDMVFVRRAFGPTVGHAKETDTAIVYVLASQSWSTVKLQQVTGQAVAAITAGVSPKTQINDEIRLLHLGYYEVLTNSGTPGTDGGDIRHLTTGLDRDVQKRGLVPWSWITPVIPLGLEYPDFQFDGFMFDAYTDASSPAPKVTWTLYSGSSPYNMVARAGPIDLPYTAGQQASTWTSSLDRQGKKEDLAFIQFRLTSLDWVQGAGLILFDSKTQPKR